MEHTAVFLSLCIRVCVFCVLCVFILLLCCRPGVEERVRTLSLLGWFWEDIRRPLLVAHSGDRADNSRLGIRF